MPVSDDVKALLDIIESSQRTLIFGQEDEIRRLRLTDAEREAVRFCCTAALPETAKLGGAAAELCRIHGWTLRSLLERLSPPAT